MKDISTSTSVICPFCLNLQIKIGTKKGKKLLACGHAFKFKKSRSEKELDRKYIRTLDGGLELVKMEGN